MEASHALEERNYSAAENNEVAAGVREDGIYLLAGGQRSLFAFMAVCFTSAKRMVVIWGRSNSTNPARAKFLSAVLQCEWIGSAFCSPWCVGTISPNAQTLLMATNRSTTGLSPLYFGFCNALSRRAPLHFVEAMSPSVSVYWRDFLSVDLVALHCYDSVIDPRQELRYDIKHRRKNKALGVLCIQAPQRQQEGSTQDGGKGDESQFFGAHTRVATLTPAHGVNSLFGRKVNKVAPITFSTMLLVDRILLVNVEGLVKKTREDHAVYKTHILEIG